MKLSMPGGRKVARNIISLALIVLPLWNFAGDPVPVANQQEQATATASPDIPEIVQPSETSSLPGAETLTPTLETPTEVLPAYTATEASTAEEPISDQSLSGEFAPGEVLVRFRGRASREDRTRCIQSIHASITSEIGELNTLVLSVPAGKVAESIHHLQACPDLRYVEPNYLVRIADVIPTDPAWGNQYGLINIRAPQGWQLDTGSASVTIAIVDTGIDLGHADLAGKLVGGIDIVNGDNNPQDDNGHGTHVAGIAAALSNNGTGVAGVSWGARLMPVKVLNAAGNGTYANVADGIIWAADHGAQIINLSLGGGNSSQMLQDAVDYAAARSVVLVAATGNAGRNSVFYPARYPNVIAVAATDPSNAHAGFSNYGPDVDLSAPGVSIYSTFPGGYGYSNGTSMATPFVSGLAAILRGIPGNTSPDLIAVQMESTALDLGSRGVDDFFGYGLIQMDAAILSVGQNPTSTSPAPVSLPGPARGFVALPTFPPSATMTLVPTQTEAAPASPTLTATQGPAPEISDTPEIIALGTEIPTKTSFGMSISNWFLPCCGASLILLGLLLFWMARQEQKKNRRLFRR